MNRFRCSPGFFCAFLVSLTVHLTSGIPVKQESDRPKIVFSKNITALMGDDVTLECGVENFDLSMIQGYSINWSKVEEDEDELLISKNEDVLSDDRRYSVTRQKDTYQYPLSISKTKEEDHGEYLCTIDFGEGQHIKAKVPLMVKVPAFFSDNDTKTLIVNEGDSITISCLPGGFPAPEVIWEKVDEDSPSYYSSNVFKSDHFDLPDVDRTHRGKYRCHADNKMGPPATSEIVIEVHYKPNVGAPNHKLASTINRKVSMECFAQGFPLPEIVWMKDGFPVMPASNIELITQTSPEQETISSTMTILKVQAEDFGEYSCAAVNTLGSAREEMNLKMESPPLIMKQAKGEVLFEDLGGLSGRTDNKILLECNAEAAPDPKYRWTKNGEPIYTHPDGRFDLVEGTGTLSILNPTETENGDYRCYAYNKLGIAASDLIKVRNVQEITFEDHEPHTLYEAELGRPFFVKCPDARGYPSPKIHWVKSYDTDQGLEVEFIEKKLGRIIADPHGYLWFSHVTEEDDTLKNNFKYLCLASTDYNPKDLSLARTIDISTIEPRDGNRNIEQEHLNIESFEMFTSEQKVKFKSFERNALWCVFGGEPLPSVEWSKVDGKPLIGSKYVIENFGRTLVFQNTLAEDAGKYRCTADNGVGKMKEVLFDVDVEIKPQFRTLMETQSQVVQEGTTVVFNCGLEGAQNVTYKWYYNSKDLTIATGSRREINGSTLTIHNVMEADQGNYACRANNSVGHVFGQAILTVIENSQKDTSYSALSGISQIQEDISSLKTDINILTKMAKKTLENTKNNTKMLDLLMRLFSTVQEIKEEEKVSMIEDKTRVASKKPETRSEGDEAKDKIDDMDMKSGEATTKNEPIKAPNSENTDVAKPGTNLKKKTSDEIIRETIQETSVKKEDDASTTHKEDSKTQMADSKDEAKTKMGQEDVSNSKMEDSKGNSKAKTENLNEESKTKMGDSKDASKTTAGHPKNEEEENSGRKSNPSKGQKSKGAPKAGKNNRKNIKSRMPSRRSIKTSLQ